MTRCKSLSSAIEEFGDSLKKCKYIFKEVLFNSSDHIITNVVLCMLVCLGGRKGKTDVDAKQLTYLKKRGGGALIQSRPALNKNNSLFC